MFAQTDSMEWLERKGGKNGGWRIQMALRCIVVVVVSAFFFFFRVQDILCKELTFCPEDGGRVKVIKCLWCALKFLGELISL